MTPRIIDIETTGTDPAVKLVAHRQRLLERQT
jgi:hypothetical protein